MRRLGSGSGGGEEMELPEIQGVEIAREQILRFLTDTVGTVKTDVIVGQVFQYAYNKNEPFHQFEFEASEDLNKIADDVMQIAEQDIGSMSGNVKVNYGFQLAQHNGRRNFVLSIGSSKLGLSEAEMLPISQNLIAQQMGHNQALMEVSVGSFGAQLKMMSKLLAKREERISWLEAERERYLQSREAILSFQHERDLKNKQQEKQDFRTDQLVSTAMNALAPVVNKFVQQKILPEKTTPLEGMMIALASTMTPEQVQKLIGSGVFSPAQLTNFLQMFQAIHDSFEEEKKRLAHGTNGTSGPAIPEVTVVRPDGSG